MTPEEIVQAMDFSVEVDSIDRTVRQSDGSEISLLDRLQVENTRTEELLNRVMLEQLLADRSGTDNGSVPGAGEPSGKEDSETDEGETDWGINPVKIAHTCGKRKAVQV